MLTQKQIDRASYQGDGESWDVRYDGKGVGTVPGFGVRIYPSGVKSFVLRYRLRTGRTRIVSLGRYGVLTLDQARAKARKDLVRVSEGADPVGERKVGRVVLTVKELGTLYIERHAKPHRRSWKEDQRRIDQRINPALGHLALADVKRSNVSALHAEVGKKAPVEANRTVELLRAMFAKAVAWGLVPETFPNPAKVDPRGDGGIATFREQSRERYVTPAELPKLWEAIGAEENVHVRAALRLFLLTGLRRRELLSAKWEDVDLEACEWRVPRTKSGKPHVVHLSAPAVEILASLPRLSGNPHVFPGHKLGTSLQNVEKNWRTARTAAGIPDVTLHDLRRTVGSWLASSGTSLAVVGAALGHAPGDVQATAIYARLQRDTVRTAVEEHGERVLATVTPPKKRKGKKAARVARIAELEAELERLRKEGT